MVVGFFALLLSACTSDEMTTDTPSDLMLMYQESEPGIDAYMTRVLVNKHFMRLDEGGDQTNYTLYDRQKNIIYTVSHAEKTIMQVKPVKTDNKITRKLVLDAKKLADKDLPEIAGQQPVHYQLKVNNAVCSDVFVVDDMHREAMLAMQEFNRVLASIHLKNIKNTPESMQDDCFLAHHVMSPSRSMQFGFPILEQNANGVTRLLVDFDKHFKVDSDVFSLPEGYRSINMAGTSLDAGI
jgi:hypothetical protein